MSGAESDDGSAEALDDSVDDAVGDASGVESADGEPVGVESAAGEPEEDSGAAASSAASCCAPDGPELVDAHPASPAASSSNPAVSSLAFRGMANLPLLIRREPNGSRCRGHFIHARSAHRADLTSILSPLPGGEVSRLPVIHRLDLGLDSRRLIDVPSATAAPSASFAR